MKDGEAHLGKLTSDMNIHPESDFRRLRSEMAEEVRHFRLAGIHRKNPDPWEFDFTALVAENGDFVDLLPLTDQDIYGRRDVGPHGGGGGYAGQRANHCLRAGHHPWAESSD